MPKLTKAVIDCSLPKEKNYIIWDTEIKGFGCQILKGGTKSYVFYYWSPLTKKKGYIKIGCHGNITVDFARNAAKKLSASVASGIDPKQEKQEKEIEERQSVRFEDFFEVFMKKHILTAYKDKGKKNIGYTNLYILPYFSQKKMEEISSKVIFPGKSGHSDLATFLQTDGTETIVLKFLCFSNSTGDKYPRVECLLCLL